MKTIETAPHEFDANFIFDSDGLSPFFACDSVIKEYDGSKACQFVLDGEQWRARLSFQPSNIVNPGDTTQTGTEFAIENIREFRLKVWRDPVEDPVGQQDFNVHLTPRWQGMRVENSDGRVSEHSIPDSLTEGVNCSLRGSNIEFSRYPELLREAFNRLDISGRYFEEIHEMSNIQDAERYVRIHESASGPIHSRDGPIASMGHLLESDRRGYRKVVQDDTDVNGDNLPGYYHTVTLGELRIREAFPDHRLPKEVKHYYAKNADNLDSDHPLSHPKIGSSYQSSRMDSDETLRFRNLQRLNRELEQTVLSVLADAGLDVAPTQTQESAYIESDPYFDVETSPAGPNPVNLDMSRVKQSQESVVIRHVADGLSPTQWESLETLVTDGGDVSPSDIAESHDRHIKSVRSALRDMDEMVQREYGSVSLKSEYVAELVHDAVSEAREATQRAVETAGKAMDCAERGLEGGMSAFVAFCSRNGIDFDGPQDARMQLRFDDWQNVKSAIREGFDVWTDAGMPEEDYRSAQVRFPDGSLGDAWRFI